MCRTIKRRDPERPGFWFLSYRHPHPPLTPLQTYLDLYRDIEIDSPYMGEWAADSEALPFSLQAKREVDNKLNTTQVRMARQAFYALCTHIDHQIRVVIGTLREEGLLDNTIILFTSDHGDHVGQSRPLGQATFL
ncbi:MAG: sulfatase-like hydrolase/transferase [Caldilineaceae bacterium]